MRMPTVDLSKIETNSPLARDLIHQIVKRDGTIRATKPKNGAVAYVWRHVVFNVSPKPAHHCIPVTAEFYLMNELDANPDLMNRFKDVIGLNFERKEGFSEYYNFVKAVEEWLMDNVVDKVVNAVHKEQWYGVMRWASVLRY